MAWMQAAGLGFTMLSSYMGNKQRTDDIKALNKAKRAQHDYNTEITAEMLSTLGERVDVAESEAVRTSVRSKMNIKKAQIQAEGKATVRAAQMGGGVGKRASLATFRPSERIAGDAITDANINLQTDLNNITQYLNDAANKAIANLNNSAPILGDDSENTALMLLEATGGAMNYWNSMSDASKAEVKGIFRSTPNGAVTLGADSYKASGIGHGSQGAYPTY